MKIFDAVANTYARISGNRYELLVSGHGGDFILQQEDGLMSKTEALHAAAHWISYADTIGGDARVRDSITGAYVPYTDIMSALHERLQIAGIS